jgi:ferric-dicitrate binding protein FerR (iron transport regulator)
MSDYLWDREGDDAEVARLEALLSPLAYHREPPSLPPRRRRRAVWMMAAGAAVALLALLWWRSPAGWAMTLESPDGRPISDGTLAVGAWLDTGANRARLRVAGIGAVELLPGTRARIVESGERRQLLRLERGSLSVVVNAPPRRFVVETPHATVFDLGCAFTLTVDEAGRGKLVVTAGAVALAEGAAPEVVVPAGSECGISERGPDTPYFSAAQPIPAAPIPAAPAMKIPATKTPATKLPAAKIPAVKTPTAKTPATKTPATATKTPATATKTNPPPNGLKHDSLKDLDRSIP